MRLGSIGRTEMRLHPLLFVVLAAACVLGKLFVLMQALLAIIVHEASHAVVSYAYGVRVYALELMPFGAVARLDRQGMQHGAELCIAAAGPLASLLVAGMTAVCAGLFPHQGAQTEAFMAYNLILAAVNLLPAMPLDGGRILRAILQKKLSLHTSTVIACAFGLFFGTGFLLLTGFCAKRQIYNLTFPTMGVFLLLAAVRELRLLPETEVQAYYRRLDSLRGGTPCRVDCFAVPAAMPASEAVRLLRRDRFHVLRVVDADLKLIGELDESRLLQGIATLGAQRKIGDLLAFDRCERV